jgi:hypothetical protein
MALVTPSLPAFRVRRAQQRVDFLTAQESDDPLVEPLGWDVQNAGDEQGVLGVAERGEGEQGADRGQADVAGSHAVATLVLQMVQERRDHVRGQVVPVQLLRGLAAALLDEGEQ